MGESAENAARRVIGPWIRAVVRTGERCETCGAVTGGDAGADDETRVSVGHEVHDLTVESRPLRAVR